MITGEVDGLAVLANATSAPQIAALDKIIADSCGTIAKNHTLG
jgi:hypothetical protein